jgi:hypothetical protein
MNLLKTMRREEKKLAVVADKVEKKLSAVRAAIHAFSGNGQSFRAKVSKLRGRKLSASHRRAIKLGIAKRKKEATA